MKLAHISDVQIRSFKRHDEFKQQFVNLYSSLKEQKPDHIVLTGDIVHQKSNISPELVDILADFLKELSDIAPLHMILGNHDLVMSNLSRMDSISPVVKALRSPRINLYKDSGVYPLDDKSSFVVYSCVGEESDWPKKKDIDKEKINFGLFHGMIQGAELQNGTRVEDSPYKLRQFLDSVDYLFLGDIHKLQILDIDYRAAYPGSLIQQSYGEDLDHGYLLWNIESKKKHTVDFIKLPNICPFYTINLNEDLSLPNDLNFQKRSRIRVFSRQLSVFEKKSLTDKINLLFEPCELLFLDDSSVHRQEIKILSSNEKVEDVADVAVQEKLLRAYFADVGEETFEKLFSINKLYNSQARADDETLRNVQYKLGKMSFDNTFSYGEGNSFDFSQQKGLVGVFGPNASGKSSFLVDNPLYCIFNRISKKGVVKNDLIINENKESCGVELEIFVGPDKYVIRRATHVYTKSGKKNGEPVVQGKTDVQFEVHKSDGTLENKAGEERSVTDKNIRKIFGSVDDFVATSMAPQWQLLGIIESGGTERQKLIGRYFDIDIFAKKHKLANEDWKLIKGKLKIFDERNFEQELSAKESELVLLKKQYISLKGEQKDYQKKEKSIEEEIFDLQSRKVSFSSKNKDELVKLIKGLEQEIQTLQSKRSEAVKLNALKESLNIKTLQETKILWTKVKNLEEKAHSLENGCSCHHEDNCPLHLKVVKFLKEASDIKNKLEMSEEKTNEDIVRYNNIKVDQQALFSDKAISQLEARLATARNDLAVLEKESEKIAQNNILEKKIQELKNEKNEFKYNIESLNKKMIEISSKVGATQNSIEEIAKSKKEYENIKGEYEVYEMFLNAMSKNGIVNKIIASNLHIVNAEIKKILSDVDFNVFLSSEEDGRAIEIYYERNGKKRNISLLSGMEKTLSALAIRAALVTVTTLPKSNIFVLDESFGSLDGEYKDIIIKVLEKLKNIFDCVYIVTHDEYLKDVVDYVVDISRGNDGYSRINKD